MIRAYVVDDEPLALRRLTRLLQDTGRVDVIGSSSDPLQALDEIPRLDADVLFLDIQMPELTGFELLARLAVQPFVVFTTAFDAYALKAFEVHSVDYLLKPIDAGGVDRALSKLERVTAGQAPRPPLAALLEQVQAALKTPSPERIAVCSGEGVHFIPLVKVTHFYAEDKLTFAATAEKNWIIDKTIAELEQRLDPGRFVRVHRSTLVNLTFIDELYPWFGGRAIVRLKTPARPEITVARERVKELKERLGL